MGKAVSITAAGKKNLEQELQTLIAKRPEIAQKIASARSYGDLSENEEYSAARREQSNVEGRIQEIQEILLHAKVIKAEASGRVGLGSVITILNNGKELVYTLVGAVEANPSEGKISDESPIGKAIMGKNIGDSVKLPNGRTLEIKNVQ